MITRDYLMRQLQQLIQALSLVLFHRREGADALAHGILSNTVADVTGVSLEQLRLLGRDGLTALCVRDGRFVADLAVAVADLLSEDSDTRSHVRARWLYEEALRSGGAVPVDVHERIAALPSADGA